MGWISAAHGLKGELYLRLHSEYADWLESGVELYLTPKNQIDRMAFCVDLAKSHKEGWRLSLNGVRTREQSEALKGAKVEIDSGLLVSEPGETLYLAELEGFELKSNEGEILGRVVGAGFNGAQDLLRVQPDNQGAEVLVPFVEDFIVEVDFSGKKIVMNLPDGLFEGEDA